MAVRLVGWYTRMFNKRPVVTQVITAGTLTTSGDIIAQLIENRPTGYSFRRTAVMSCFGFCYFGPLVTVWLGFLKRLNLSVIRTVMLDQAVFAPLINGGFVFLHPILSNKGTNEACRIFSENSWNVIRSCWMLWIPAQLINFSFVPFKYRMIYIQVVALFWNAFLSFRSNSAIQK
uniref:PXMP2/4 family protein 2-like isoform X1 n=1 Tax=Ciona intestinalis TaxID=7719 RepID=UPI00006A6A5B|nr:PXMP2/4 family protein 2-like isoform X1 [Ciona intestinalis]|eukprot:XP_002123172.1 PXMP2/4 family protein 2-like isoform X1 [Ciona intestinalis]